MMPVVGTRRMAAAFIWVLPHLLLFCGLHKYLVQSWPSARKFCNNECVAVPYTMDIGGASGKGGGHTWSGKDFVDREKHKSA